MIPTEASLPALKKLMTKGMIEARGERVGQKLYYISPRGRQTFEKVWFSFARRPARDLGEHSGALFSPMRSERWIWPLSAFSKQLALGKDEQRRWNGETSRQAHRLRKRSKWRTAKSSPPVCKRKLTHCGRWQKRLKARNRRKMRRSSRTAFFAD